MRLRNKTPLPRLRNHVPIWNSPEVARCREELLQVDREREPAEHFFKRKEMWAA